MAQTLNNLALVYDAQGKYAEAEGLHRRALGIREMALGADQPKVAATLINLANLSVATGSTGQALAFSRQATAKVIAHAATESPHQRQGAAA